MQSHYSSASIPWGLKSLARWAVNPNGTLVVFVHGFNGQSVGTWSEFNELLPDRPEGRGVDLVFFGYESLRRRVTPCALELYEFLVKLLDAPHRQIDASLGAARRVESFGYKKVVLVCHSAGAVIARKTLLNAYRNRDPWASLVELLLFAPAHMGAHVIPLIRSAASLFKSIPFEALAKWHFPILEDLEEGSLALNDLRAETNAAITSGAAYLAAKLIVLSEHDAVVNNNDFTSHDAVPRSEPKSHVLVCKPTDDYMSPLQYVVKHL